MKMTDIEELLEKYDAGETTLEEEEQLTKYFTQEKVPAHLEVYASQFKVFAQKKSESVKEYEAVEKLLSKVEAGKMPVTPKQKSIFVNWGMGIAASLVLLLVGFMGGRLYEGQQIVASTNTEVIEARQELAQMKEILLSSQEEQSSASDRIKAVNQVSQFNEIDKDLVQLLVNTMNFDPNINVRIAASEALFHYHEDPLVRLALVNSLKIQKDPAIQIILIDMLIEIKEKRAVDTMRKLMQNDDVLEMVKLKAEQGIGSLS